MQPFTNPLDQIQIASPCSADWNEMYGNDRVRFCAECKLNVYNLSEMSKIEAERLLINTEGRICVRVYKRSDGTVITKDCPSGLAAARRKVLRFVTAGLSMTISFIVGLGFSKAFGDTQPNPPSLTIPKQQKENPPKISFGGAISNLSKIKADILRDQSNI